MDKLKELACALAEAKRLESELKAKRVTIEEEIAALVETEANGSRTVDAGDGIKVTVKRALGYKADLDGIRSLSIPEEVMPIKMTDPVPASYTFDSKRYECIVKNHPDVAAKLASHVVVVPRKVSVSVKVA